MYKIESRKSLMIFGTCTPCLLRVQDDVGQELVALHFGGLSVTHSGAHVSTLWLEWSHDTTSSV